MFLINPFHATDLFWYPLKTCFQGVSKEISGMKWVKKRSADAQFFISNLITVTIAKFLRTVIL